MEPQPNIMPPGNVDGGPAQVTEHQLSAEVKQQQASDEFSDFRQIWVSDSNATQGTKTLPYQADNQLEQSSLGYGIPTYTTVSSANYSSTDFNMNAQSHHQAEISYQKPSSEEYSRTFGVSASGSFEHLPVLTKSLSNSSVHTAIPDGLQEDSGSKQIQSFDGLSELDAYCSAADANAEKSVIVPTKPVGPLPVVSHRVLDSGMQPVSTSEQPASVNYTCEQNSRRQFSAPIPLTSVPMNTTAHMPIQNVHSYSQNVHSNMNFGYDSSNTSDKINQPVYMQLAPVHGQNCLPQQQQQQKTFGFFTHMSLPVNSVVNAAPFAARFEEANAPHSAGLTYANLVAPPPIRARPPTSSTPVSNPKSESNGPAPIETRNHADYANLTRESQSALAVLRNAHQAGFPRSTLMSAMMSWPAHSQSQLKKSDAHGSGREKSIAVRNACKYKYFPGQQIFLSKQSTPTVQRHRVTPRILQHGHTPASLQNTPNRQGIQQAVCQDMPRLAHAADPRHMQMQDRNGQQPVSTAEMTSVSMIALDSSSVLPQKDSLAMLELSKRENVDINRYPALIDALSRPPKTFYRTTSLVPPVPPHRHNGNDVSGDGDLSDGTCAVNVRLSEGMSYQSKNCGSDFKSTELGKELFGDGTAGNALEEDVLPPLPLEEVTQKVLIGNFPTSDQVNNNVSSPVREETEVLEIDDITSIEASKSNQTAPKTVEPSFIFPDMMDFEASYAVGVGARRHLSAVDARTIVCNVLNYNREVKNRLERMGVIEKTPWSSPCLLTSQMTGARMEYVQSCFRAVSIPSGSTGYVRTMFPDQIRKFMQVSSPDTPRKRRSTNRSSLGTHNQAGDLLEASPLVDRCAPNPEHGSNSFDSTSKQEAPRSALMNPFFPGRRHQNLTKEEAILRRVVGKVVAGMVRAVCVTEERIIAAEADVPNDSSSVFEAPSSVVEAPASAVAAPTQLVRKRKKTRKVVESLCDSANNEHTISTKDGEMLDGNGSGADAGPSQRERTTTRRTRSDMSLRARIPRIAKKSRME